MTVVMCPVTYFFLRLIDVVTRRLQKPIVGERGSIRVELDDGVEVGKRQRVENRDR